MKTKPLALLAAAAFAAAALAPLRSQETAPAAPPAEEEGTVLGYDTDATQRMTVAVDIDGQGPYHFIVDTGAERTVIASSLARVLGLDPGSVARVHSMSEVSDIATVVIPSLTVGGKLLRGIQAPALDRTNLGAEGMLGVDSLQSQRVSFDFKRQEMTVVPSRKREEVWTEDSIVIVGRSRFGRLVLVDAAVDGQKVWVIIDTGSQVTVGNTALRHKLERKGRLAEMVPIELVSVTGGRVTAQETRVKHIKLGDMEIKDMPIAFADVHPFKKLKLTKRPAILLGMNALKLFDRVSVDFPNRRVRLLAPIRSSLEAEAKMARADRSRPTG